MNPVRDDAHQLVMRLGREREPLSAEACWLVATIAHQQQESGGIPVGLFNEQLMALARIRNVTRLEALRAAAVKAGWLRYEKGARGRPGMYLAVMPDESPVVPQKLVSELLSDFPDTNSVSVRVTVENSGQKLFDATGPPASETPEVIEVATKRKPGLLFEMDAPEPAKGGGGVSLVTPPDIHLRCSGEATTVPSNGEAIAPKETQADAVRAVFSHYRKLHPRAHPRPVPESKEWKLIVARLNEGYSVEDICEAIDGCHKTPHNCGMNENQTKYQDLDLIVRKSGNVARFLENNRSAPQPVLNQKSQKASMARESYLAKRFPEQEEF